MPFSYKASLPHAHCIPILSEGHNQKQSHMHGNYYNYIFKLLMSTVWSSNIELLVTGLLKRHSSLSSSLTYTCMHALSLSLSLSLLVCRLARTGVWIHICQKLQSFRNGISNLSLSLSLSLTWAHSRSQQVIWQGQVRIGTCLKVHSLCK